MKYNDGHGVQMDADHGKGKMGAFGPGVHPSIYLPPPPLLRRLTKLGTGPGKMHGIGLDR